jgi:hypothetical protein
MEKMSMIPLSVPVRVADPIYMRDAERSAALSDDYWFFIRHSDRQWRFRKAWRFEREGVHVRGAGTVYAVVPRGDVFEGERFLCRGPLVIDCDAIGDAACAVLAANQMH